MCEVNASLLDEEDIAFLEQLPKALTFDLAALEAYMAELASSIIPFEVHLTELQLQSIVFKGTEFRLLWIDVQETDQLRQLHSRVNQELSHRFGNTQADYDGPAYHFHMTVVMGGQPIEDGIAALEWLARAFGFRERGRQTWPDGRLSHGEMEAG